MNDALCRGAWDKGCTDIMYMTIEYPNYPIILEGVDTINMFNKLK